MNTGFISHRGLPVGAMIALVLLFIAGCTSQSQTDEKTVEHGRSLYAENCQSCHGDAETGRGALANAPVHGPNGHTWHHADGQLTQIILGEFDYPGKTMPSFADILKEEDVVAILTYFKTNWPADQRSFQAETSSNWDMLRKTN